MLNYPHSTDRHIPQFETIVCHFFRFTDTISTPIKSNRSAVMTEQKIKKEELVAGVLKTPVEVMNIKVFHMYDVCGSTVE